MSLRPYQIKAIEEIRENYKSGKKKVLLHMATGGGKTVIFSEVMKRTVAAGKKCIMVVRGRQLVDQASSRLLRENVFHGVKMAGHWNKQHGAPIQICSIDTLISRGEKPNADLIVIDEAHLAMSKGYIDFLSQYDDVFILAVTATPFVKASMRHIADVIVNPVSISDLIKQGFLVDARTFAPSKPDLSNVKISKLTGDYVTEEIEEIMSSRVITGDIISHWIKIAKDKPTICFATSIKHSMNIVEQFLLNGIEAEHCDANTKDEDRKAILSRLEIGKTKVVSNVGILCTGVDMPYLQCIIMARPTQSYNLYIQQAGRGTRIFEGKENFILLDHAGNSTKHGLITQERYVDLDGEETSDAQKLKTCKVCFAVFSGFKCPEGCEPPEEDSDKPKNLEVLNIDGELKEILEISEDTKIMLEIELLKATAKKKGYKRGWAYYKIKEKYGEQVTEKYMPKRQIPDWIKRKST